MALDSFRGELGDVLVQTLGQGRYVGKRVDLGDGRVMVMHRVVLGGSVRRAFCHCRVCHA